MTYAFGAAANTSADTPSAYFSKFFTNKPARYFAFEVKAVLFV